MSGRQSGGIISLTTTGLSLKPINYATFFNGAWNSNLLEKEMVRFHIPTCFEFIYP